MAPGLNRYMNPRDPVDAIFALHGIRGAWKALAATGVANRIYATQDVVLRIATDHPDAVVDASVVLQAD